MSVRSRVLRIALVVVGLALLGLAILWLERENIARHFADAQLASRKVRATYRIARVGPYTQRIEHLVVGDPARPDLTADWAEVGLTTWLSGVTISTIRASGVRLHGQLIDGRLSLGEVDKLLPKPTGKPFSFPDIYVELSDANMGLQTPYGPLGLTINGKGNLARHFSAQSAFAAPELAIPGCAMTGVIAEGRVTVLDRVPGFHGPVQIANVKCGANQIERAVANAEASSSEAFDRWTGSATLKADRVSAAQASAKRLVGQIDFAGDSSGTLGKYALTATSATTSDATLGRTELSGGYQLGRDASKAVTLQSAGMTRLTGIVPAQSLLAGLRGMGRRAAGTPLVDIANALEEAFTGLSRGGDATAHYELSQSGGSGQLSLSSVQAQSLSGAKIAMQGAPPILLRWPVGGLALNGTAQVVGGGFPTSTIRLSGRGGTATIAPLADQNTRLALTPVRFAYGSRGLSLDTVATLDGPLGGGQVTGLVLPIAVRGNALDLTCLPVQFTSYKISTLTLTPNKIAVCLKGGQANIAAPRFVGRLGSSPISLAAKSARVGTGDGSFRLEGAKVRLGTASRMTALDLGSISGIIKNGAASGSYAGTSGQIANVPLLLSEAAGRWQFLRDAFTTQAHLRVADAAPAFRFSPLISKDFTLRLANGKIAASGMLIAPKSGVAVSHVTISHDLAAETGSAVLDVAGLTFGPTLQPEEITPITLGVIANVNGTLKGRGQINWTSSGVTSTGGFRTNAMDMAAAFGPVTGLSGEISLSNLLGLETPAGQHVSIAAINPGVAVLDGEISYRLLPGLKVQIEGGRWPFAGGFLILEPTTLDLSEAAQRRMTFRVEGLDAARFIAQLEFDNIAATGIFDGTLPMVFDKEGGRIVGGSLIARGGGTLSYVGEISNENLGTMGRIAFDALKSIKYNRLAIDLDGALDGDIVTKVRFAGVNQAPIEGVRAKLPIPIHVSGLTNFPFIFNVTITAPFRQLFETARSINDPTRLIERMVPQLQAPPNASKTDKPVQPKESETVR
jgi:translocation and assembly module TamB